MTYTAALIARSTKEPIAQPRCVWSILMRVRSPGVALSENLSKEFARIHAMRGVVRTRIHAARLSQVRAQIAGGSLLFDRGFLAARVFGIVGHHFKRMQVDVAVGAVARAEAAPDAPVFDDHFQGMAAANRADRATDHAEGIAALAAGSGDQVIFEAQAVAHQAGDSVVRVGAG